MMYANVNECEAAGLDPKKVESISRRISRAARDANAMGMIIFGGNSGDLRYDDGNGGYLIVASLDGRFDGGDGGACHDDLGLLRGEHA